MVSRKTIKTAPHFIPAYDCRVRSKACAVACQSGTTRKSAFPGVQPSVIKVCGNIVSGTVNGILQCGLGGQKLTMGKKDLLSKMRP